MNRIYIPIPLDEQIIPLIKFNLKGWNTAREKNIPLQAGGEKLDWEINTQISPLDIGLIDEYEWEDAEYQRKEGSDLGPISPWIEKLLDQYGDWVSYIEDQISKDDGTLLAKAHKYLKYEDATLTLYY